MNDRRTEKTRYSAAGRREKAEARSDFVRKSQAELRSVETAKTDKLRALRLAKLAGDSAP